MHYSMPPQHVLCIVAPIQLTSVLVQFVAGPFGAGNKYILILLKIFIVLLNHQTHSLHDATAGQTRATGWGLCCNMKFGNRPFSVSEPRGWSSLPDSSFTETSSLARPISPQLSLQTENTALQQMLS